MTAVAEIHNVRGGNVMTILMAVALAWVATENASGQESPNFSRVGISAELQKKLDRKLAAAWSEAPLRRVLRSLSESQAVPIFLDRRVDPGVLVTYQSPEQPLDRVLSEVSAEVGVHVCALPKLIYVGPSHVTAVLPSQIADQRERVLKLPTRRRDAFAASRAWRWPVLSTPRELLEALAEQGEFTLADQQRLPHDLWPDYDLPPMPLIDRLAVLLAGFDLTVQLTPDGSAISLVPLPERATISKDYRNLNRQMLDWVGETLPQAEVQTLGQGARIAATLEEHHQIAERLEGGRPSMRRTAPAHDNANNDLANKRFRLNVDQVPVGAVLKTIQTQTKLEIVLSQNAQSHLRDPVSIKTENATLQQLLDQTLKPIAMRYVLEDKRLIISMSDE